MTIDDLLPRLESVRQRGSGRWSARCPGHADKSPSLSISEGDKGLLLRCWAGCTVAEICGGLGLSQRDLFYDRTPDPNALRAAQVKRVQKARAQEAAGFTVDALRAAEDFIGSRRGLDISQWSNQRLEDELNALGVAYALLESEAAV